MEAFQKRFFPLDIYPDPLTARRALGNYAMGSGALVGVALAGVLYLAGSLAGRFALDFNTLLIGGIIAGAGATTLVLTIRKQQFFGALIMLIGWFLLISIQMLVGKTALSVGFAALMLGISASALLIGGWGVLAAALLAAPLTLISTLISHADTSLIPTEMLILAVHTVLNFTLARSLRAVGEQMTARVEARNTRLASASGVLAQQLLSARLDLGALLQGTVKLVRETFSEVSVAQLYLVDKDKRNATLVASTNTTGTSNLGQKIGVGSLNVIGRVTISGQSVIVRDTPEEQPYRRTAFVDGTHAELVLPLRVGSEIIGALDLQSGSLTAFSTEDVEVLETLVHQIAIAIDNALLYADAQEKLTENKRLYEQTSASLNEIERLTQQLAGRAWTEYLRGISASPAYTIDPISGRIEEAAERTPTMQEASRRNQTIIRNSQQGKTVTLPISVRGQVIGTMEFELQPNQEVPAEQMTLLRQVVDRLGLAAENMRLLEEAQRIAQREATVNVITARMQAATNVEAVVATAVQSVADAFQAPRVSIRLGTPNPRSAQK